MISFEIPGCPVPWAASRISKFGALDPRAKEKINITWHLKLQMQKMQIKFPLKGALRLEAVFYMQIPHTTPKKKRASIAEGEMHHICKPDLTNLCKLYEDMLQRAGILENDSNIVSTNLSKVYGEHPKVVLRIGKIEQPPRELCL